jgi:hypothetical protein
MHQTLRTLAVGVADVRTSGAVVAGAVVTAVAEVVVAVLVILAAQAVGDVAAAPVAQM